MKAKVLMAASASASRMTASLFALLALSFLFVATFVQNSQAIEIQEVKSPGGITAWLVEDYTVPIIALNFAFAGGSSQDSDAKLGVTNLLSTMLDEGAGDLDSQAFQGRLEDLTMSLSFSSGRDFFYGSFQSLQANKDHTFEMLRLAVNEPRFDNDPLERMKAQTISGIRRSLKRPDALAGLNLSKTIFPDHPYGRPSRGTEDTVAKLTSDDLKTQRAKIFAKDSLKIGVVGAISADELASVLDKVFANLPENGDLVAIPNVEPVTDKAVHVDFESPQTSIQFALPGYERHDPKFMSAFVMNHILGGGSFSSWLYDEIREQRGLAYSVGSYLVPYKHAALLMGSTGTRSDKAGEAIDIIKKQMVRMAQTGPTPAELEEAKSYLTGNYALNFDSSSSIARQLTGIQTQELGIDYIDKRNEMVEAVTLEGVREVAQDMFDGIEPTFVTVGKPLN
ncbi:MULTISPECIES: pitrilysin family protein [unclassified Pseudovibrio]|uniref:M16 family metallopeptidase n=1 Tax=unclassified Pseudovibrio TaxID=2627060 RepID=UPI0007AE9E68|nr:MULTISPECIES: pitrilysin family protein [unclassified Pseudovibrio]KZK94193.1 Peptidase M16 inactive domain protein [Pseudovibrio sp. W74]KZL09952.1 Peptidase M16 inactive domain protein [Pseudovibrio sp. Ad14]